MNAERRAGHDPDLLKTTLISLVRAPDGAQPEDPYFY